MKKLIKKLTWSSLFFVLLLSFYQCSNYKKIATDKRLAKISNFKQAYWAVTSPCEYSQLQIKYKLSLSIEEKNNKLAGTIKYLNDSILWINIVSKTLGIELLRAKFTPDSLFFIDRINKKHYAGTYEKLQQRLGFPLDYYFLRTIFFGKVYGLSFHYSLKNMDLFVQKLHSDKTFYFEYKLQNTAEKYYPILKNPEIETNFTVNRKGFLLSNKYENKQTYKSLQIADYKYNKNFPQSFVLTATKKDKTYQLHFIYTELSSENVSVSYKIPKNYERVE